MFIAALLVTIAAAPQAAPAKPSVPAAPATSAKLAPTAAPAATSFSLDTPIETLVADPAAKAVLDAEIPGITAHPMYEQFKTMSLTQLAPMSGGKLSEEALAKTKTRLAAIK